ncbi:MAG TPA: SDR family oxidoreductase [Pseudoduganella sp.]
MKVLVVGASGFIGRTLCERLAADGHHVVRGVRNPAAVGDIAIDYSAPRDWCADLAGFDAVINTVGIIVERPGEKFVDVHERGPSALFAACAQAGVRRVVQISALGADRADRADHADSANTAYFRSKFAADRALAALPMEWQIVRPSLVFGTGGTSAALFSTLASLPVIPVPALGEARFQPMHIDDLCDAITRLLLPDVSPCQEIDLVGATSVSYRAMLDAYRRMMGFAPGAYLTIPAPLMRLAAGAGALIPGATLTPDTWRMLRAGSSAATPDAVARVADLLGRPPRGVNEFMAPCEAELLRHRALSAWRGPLLRAVLAVIWIATAVISAFVYPVEGSLSMLAALGIKGAAAYAALYGASLLDLAFGIATLAWPRRVLWAAQAALIVGYTAAIAIALPEYLTHPFGPLLKNLPILAILIILYSESKAWTTSR